MSAYQERVPIRLKVINKVLGNDTHTQAVCPYGLFTASNEGLELVAKQDGKLVDKLQDGLHVYGNQFAGGDRSAFCSMQSSTWNMRDVVKTTFGGRRVEKYQSVIGESAAGAVDLLISAPEVSIPTNQLSRELVLRVSELVMFGIDLPKESLTRIAEAYADFNNWFALSTSTKGFVDRGRYPKLNYTDLIEDQDAEISKSKDVLDLLSRTIFRKKQHKFNESVQLIQTHASQVWEHLQQTNNPLSSVYKQKIEELQLDETAIILDLTNIIGATISSPPAFLAFSLSVFSKVGEEEKKRILQDQAYRKVFFLEIQRMYQPLSFFVRDIVGEVSIDGHEANEGNFLFSTYTYNRRTDIWGEDASQYRPERFVEDPGLAHKLIFFGKGRRRCPAGQFGEAIATTCFNTIISRFDVQSAGPLEVNLAEGYSPKGNVFLTRKVS